MSFVAVWGSSSSECRPDSPFPNHSDGSCSLVTYEYNLRFEWWNRTKVGCDYIIVGLRNEKGKGETVIPIQMKRNNRKCILWPVIQIIRWFFGSLKIFLRISGWKRKWFQKYLNSRKKIKGQRGNYFILKETFGQTWKQTEQNAIGMRGDSLDEGRGVGFNLQYF